ncbi:hypothetical protein [Pseudosporangium ferrugineum]|uniref:hypothetical protein n=1 Tax=Pseudosporangium ferrugineum TaxID=439699 RepID=UPI001304B193|nr:hypothetical protein [Pseudosporangium ferrugineum]
MSAEDCRQAVAAVAAMIHEWWSGGHGRSFDAVRGSDPSDDAAAELFDYGSDLRQIA